MPECAIEITLAWETEARIRVESLRLPAGSTIAQALAAAAAAGIAVAVDARGLAVFGSLRPLGFVLRDGDRIELTRALRVDPKLARQRRVANRRAQRERDDRSKGD